MYLHSLKERYLLEKSRKKKKLGSTRSGIVFFSFVLSLTIIGILASLIAHADGLIKNVQNDIELHVYLESNLNQTNRSKLEKIISKNSFVNLEAKKPIEYISQERLANQLIEKEYIQEDFEKILGYNPIRSCFVVKIKKEYATSQPLSIIKKELESTVGVYEVDLSTEKQNDIEAVFSNLKLIFIILMVSVIITILTLSLLINNTIKLALFSQRFLIRSMKLVGAEKSFIKTPFLKSSSFQGFWGGLVAAGITWAITQFTYNHVGDLSTVVPLQNMVILLCGLVLLGMIIGFLSSLFALNKYLNYSLDDLY